KHDGIEKFTIGQRKGLGFGSSARRYVLQIVPDSNTVVVGDREDLLATTLTASGGNWLIDPPLAAPLSCQAKIRYRHRGPQAQVGGGENGEAVVSFAEPQSAITPGQAVVFYDGDRVLGGGWIERALP